jgi:uncharacterized protein YecE (DUF72 family)
MNETNVLIGPEFVRVSEPETLLLASAEKGWEGLRFAMERFDCITIKPRKGPFSHTSGSPSCRQEIVRKRIREGLKILASGAKEGVATPSFKVNLYTSGSAIINSPYAKKQWENFWNGVAKPFHRRQKLGCVIMEFLPTFDASPSNLRKLRSMGRWLPTSQPIGLGGDAVKRHPSNFVSVEERPIKFAFEFRHWSWWNSLEVVNFFLERPNWCIATVYIENELVSNGWAGNLPSTRTIITATRKMKPIVTTDWTYFVFHGTKGKHVGSYDEHNFLERFAEEVRNLTVARSEPPLPLTAVRSEPPLPLTVYTCFTATKSTFCHPLPAAMVDGFLFDLKLATLPLSDDDLPCCLHDCLKLKKIFSRKENVGGTEIGRGPKDRTTVSGRGPQDRTTVSGRGSSDRTADF